MAMKEVDRFRVFKRVFKRHNPEKSFVDCKPGEENGGMKYDSHV